MAVFSYDYAKRRLCGWAWSFPLLALFAWFSPARAQSPTPTPTPLPTNEPLDSDYMVMGVERFFWQMPVTDDGTMSLQEQAIKDILDDRLQTPENHYLAAAMYTSYMLDAARNKDAARYCEQFPPKPDHYEYIGNCILAQDLPLIEMARRLEAVGEVAVRAFPNRITGANILKVAAAKLSFSGHAHEAIRLLKLSFAALPPHAEYDIAEAKIQLAASYANPFLSQKLQRLSSQYYEDVRQWYKKLNPQTPDVVARIRWISYNKSIGHLFMFRDYAQALADLHAADGDVSLAPDIAIFKAYAYALNRQPEHARAALLQGDWTKGSIPERVAFLHCYHDLTRRIIGENVSLENCLNLQDPQQDVLLDLTKTLSTLSLKPEEENRMWRKFYGFFIAHVQPDFQESMDAASNDAELQQQKAESRLKDLKLKNMALYEDLSYALTGIVGACILAFFLGIRSWRNNRRHANEMSRGKARLQNIIDNIEEGLVQIRSGFRLLPEQSSHLLAITGGVDLQDAQLDQLLALTDLSDDARSITAQCLEAVLGEELLTWELNAPNLPREVKIQEREIAFFWQPLLQKDRVIAILLVMRNVTAINQLQRQSRKVREEADRMLEYAREILSSHPRAVASFLGELPRLIQHLSFSALQSKDFTAARRIAHSIKGTARTLGLLDLQNQAHWVEDELRAAVSEDLEAKIQDLGALGLTYTNAMQHVLGNASDMDVRSLFELVAHHKPDLERQLAAAQLRLGNLMVDESITLTRAELQPLAEIILHGMTNAVDHGFILPLRQGRPVPEARFAVSVFARGEHRILILRDNGAGIDHQKLQQQAQARGWNPNEDQIWTDFLFLEGVTTAEIITITSGRGVGMAAIRSAALKLNGRVQLLDNDEGQGSMLKLVWPAARASSAA